jgi:hypothetical protein
MSAPSETSRQRLRRISLNPPEALRLVHEHLEIRTECHAEYEALLSAMLEARQ